MKMIVFVIDVIVFALYSLYVVCVSFIVCVVLCAVFCFSVMLFCVICVLFVCCVLL
jgi:hypothetical protein